MAENKEMLVGEDLEKAVAAAEAEYDENRVVEKAAYVETDEKYNREAAAVEPEPEPDPEVAIEDEFPDYVMPLGLQQTWVRGTNRYQLTGAVCGYAGYLLLTGLLGITGLYEADTSGFLGPIMGLFIGYGIGYLLTKKAKQRVAEDLIRLRAERDAKAAQ